MDARTLQIMLGGRIPIGVCGIEEIELLEYLGGGGFGTVWKVIDHAASKLYTLKVIQGIRPGGVEAERIRLEAEVAIHSEYIVPVVGLCEWDPSTFLILFEYFKAKSLEHYLANGSLSSEQRKSIFTQILLGVADAHRNNIVHRDLKPANVLVGPDTEVKLIDFGVSKFKGRKITMDGLIIGTLPYIAPEIIINGAKDADARADIYSLGQLFYELVTGQHFWLYKGWRELTDFINYLRKVPRPTEIMELTQFNCDYFPRAGEVLLIMSKINPAERFSSVDEVLETFGITARKEPELVLSFSNPVLIIESGSNRNSRTLVNIADGASATYGRADFAGNNDSISRNHLEILRQGTRYFVRDMKSKNGTLLSGVKVSSRSWHEIRHADRIKIGDIFLRFAFMNQL